MNKTSINYQIQYQTANSAKQQMLNQRTEKQKEKIEQIIKNKQLITQNQYQQTLKQIDKELWQLIEQQIIGKIKCIVVFDFDCFFCQCEQLLDPRLSTVPFAVIGGSIVDASNYKAREYGVRSAMPVQIAKELCNELVVKQSNIKLYNEISKKAGKIFKQYDQNCQQLSIDEYSIDITQLVLKHVNNNQDQQYFIKDEYSNYLDIKEDKYSIVASNIVKQIRQQIKQQLKITVTAGVSFNLQIAKMITDFQKPDGQTISKLCFHNSQQYLNYFNDTIFKQKIRKIWGIGNASEYMLQNSLKIQTIGDIYKQRAYLTLLFTKSTQSLIYASLGFQNFTFQGEQKTRGLERTFPDTGNQDIIQQHIKEICLKLCRRLMDKNQEAKRIQIKIRFSDWSDVMKICDLQFQTNAFDQIYCTSIKEIKKIIDNKIQNSKTGKTVQAGFDKFQQEVPVWYIRLIGIRACQLVNLNSDDINEISLSELDQDTEEQNNYEQYQIQYNQQQDQEVQHSNKQIQNQKIKQQISDIQQTEQNSRKCQYCGLKFPLINIESHEERCPKNIYLIYQKKMKQKMKKGTIDSFLMKQKQKQLRK